MSSRRLCAAPFWLAVALALSTKVNAHEIAGNRLFPATLATDDPGVNDELAVPTISYFKNGDDPSAKQLDVSGEYSKRITDAFAISLGSTWTHLSPSWMPSVSGFQNLDTSFKYRLIKDPVHEFIVSVGLGVEWGGTGAARVGAEQFNTYTPTIFFGKGFGDLPDTAMWLRPVAVTGQVGYAIPGRRSTTTFGIDPDTGDLTTDVQRNPQSLVWGGSLQYSMLYLKSAVIDLGLSEFVNRLIPLVEASFQTPVANTLTSGTVTTGTINPGVIWVGDYFQVGLEAVIPVNRQSGTSVGVMGQLHFYLDNIDPHGIGKPIFGTSTQPLLPVPGR